MTLESLGWTERHEALFTEHRARGLEPARVARQDRERYLVLTVTGPRPAEVTGRFRHAAASPAEFPAVGDWVGVRDATGQGAAAIHAVLPRASAFARRAAGETTEEQVVAANVDVVFLVAGLDGDFNPRRIERYVAAAWESGAEPVLVLNKTDLAEDVAAVVAGVEALAPGVPVVALSARDGTGLEALAPWLAPGRTVALLGSSGVGAPLQRGSSPSMKPWSVSPGPRMKLGRSTPWRARNARASGRDSSKSAESSTSRTPRSR